MSIERGTNKRRTTTRRVIGILLACVTLACATQAEALTPRRGTLKTRSVLNGIRRDQLGFPTRIPKGFAVGMTERGTSGRLREREIDFATLRAKGLVEDSSGNPIGAASGYFALNSTQDAHMVPGAAASWRFFTKTVRTDCLETKRRATWRCGRENFLGTTPGTSSLSIPQWAPGSATVDREKTRPRMKRRWRTTCWNSYRNF